VEPDKLTKSELVGQISPQLPWKQKRGIQKKIGFLSSNFMKICKNIHRSVWQLFGGVEKNFKMAAVAMVTKVQNGRQIQNPPIWAKFGFK
jgi:hypothetical protein